MPKIPPVVPCDRCERPIAPGASRYIMTLRLTADFDGYIQDITPEESPGSTMNTLDSLSEEELDAQVDQRFAFTLCPRCRTIIGGNPTQKRGLGGQHDPRGKLM